MTTSTFFNVCFVLLWTFPVFSQPGIHSHNDYNQDIPLVLALSVNAASIEADVFLEDGVLMVAHSKNEIEPERTLKIMYLDPLFELFRLRNNQIYHDQSLILLVDIKADGEKVYQTLKKLLAPYHSMLTSWHQNIEKKGAVTLILSGDRPISSVAGDTVRFVAIDGRPSELNSNHSAHLFPLVSQDWDDFSSAFNSDEELESGVRQWVEKAHERGQKVRFWGTPDRESFWIKLINWNVDLINTDQPGQVAVFLIQTQLKLNK